MARSCQIHCLCHQVPACLRTLGWGFAVLFCFLFFPGDGFLAGEFWAPQVFFDAFVKGSRGTEESWAGALPWDEAPATVEGL